MEYFPPLDEFCVVYDKNQPQIIYTRLITDLETPVSAYLKLSQQQNYSFLMESVADGDVRGRYSMIGLAPDLVFRIKNGNASISRENGDATPCKEKPLTALRDLIADNQFPLPPQIPNVAAGLYGYLGYDIIREVEDIPDNNPESLDIPDGLFIRPSIIAVFDNITDQLILATPVYPQATKNAQNAYNDAIIRLEDVVDTLLSPLPPQSATPIEMDETPTTNMSQQDYFARVERAKDYIKAGDVFQLVLSQKFSSRFTLPPFELYRSLRRVNPSPYLFFLNFENFSVIGSSPEVLVGLSDDKVNIRPIAGTRHRGGTPEDDMAIAEDLLSDPKELAEHLMLLDLGRNDVGRVAQIGSVEVTHSFEIQKTSHLLHIVSNIIGTIAPDHDALSALMAGFPAGTVSGAPKIRAMEIIDELEPKKRGLYAGAVGYFSATGDMDMCIALRTGIIKDQTLYVQAGGGIVYDSTPQYEYDETIGKSAALFSAAREAIRVAQERRNR